MFNSNLMLFMIVAAVSMVSCISCEQTPQNQSAMPVDTLTFLALGDSYTIGESVAENERWPAQLQARTMDDSNTVKLADPFIIATTGWTTDELHKGIDAAQIEGNKYDLVSLLIGVNNQYRDYPIAQYEAEFEELLNRALDFAAGDSNRVFVVSIPDYGVTPFGQERNPEKIAEELDAYNNLARTICENYGVDFLDITPISREAASKPDLTASDRLHPSGKMYQLWVDQVIFPWFRGKMQ